MKCEAPQGCENEATSWDHHTPICIAKVLGWDRSQYGAKENLQPLCQPCHTEKDRSTTAKLQQVKFQLRGGSIEFGNHK